MRDEMKEIIEKLSEGGYPLITVYGMCKRLCHPVERSTDRYYIRVYRRLEKLVSEGKMNVARGTRDPSVYFNRNWHKSENTSQDS